MPLPNFFRPRAGAFGVQLIATSVVIGTGGVSVGDTTTTSYLLPCPRRSAVLSSLTLNVLIAALSAGGTVLATLYKRDNAGTPVDRTLTGAISLEADTFTVLDKSYAWPILSTATLAQRTLHSGDAFRIDVVTGSSVGTQPTLAITAVWDVLA